MPPFKFIDICPGCYIVLCRNDRNMVTGAKGKYAMATSRGFATIHDARYYMGAISSSRQPYIAKVEG